MDSILTSVKKLCGMPEEYTSFDQDVIMAINTSISTLTQLGVGPSEGFVVIDKQQTWTDFLGQRKDLESIKSYVYMNTRLIFDPPQNAFLIESYNRILKETEWRILTLMDKEVPACTKN